MSNKRPKARPWPVKKRGGIPLRCKIRILGLTISALLLFLGCSDTAFAQTELKQQVLQRINQSIVLYLDSPVAYVDGAKVYVDTTNREIGPIVKMAEH